MEDLTCVIHIYTNDTEDEDGPCALDQECKLGSNLCYRFQAHSGWLIYKYFFQETLQVSNFIPESSKQ